MVRADTHQGSCRKRGDRRKGENCGEPESKRAGGVTLCLLPNLASESATAGEGGGLWVRLTYPV